MREFLHEHHNGETARLTRGDISLLDYPVRRCRTDDGLAVLHAPIVTFLGFLWSRWPLSFSLSCLSTGLQTNA